MNVEFPITFGIVEDRVRVDLHNNPVSILHMSDGIKYNLVHYPLEDGEPKMRLCVFNTEKYTPHMKRKYSPVFISSILKESKPSEYVRYTSASVGAFTITWVNGVVVDVVAPDFIPKEASVILSTFPEDINDFIVFCTHYIAVLNLWREKPHAHGVDTKHRGNAFSIPRAAHVEDRSSLVG